MAKRSELIGYAVPMIAHPGDTVQIMVSAEAETYTAEVVRLIHGDNNPAGPGFKADVVPSPTNGTYPGRLQKTHTGSFARVDVDSPLDLASGLTLQAWIWPTTPDKASQGVITSWSENAGFGLYVDSGAVVFRVGEEQVVSPSGLTAGRWHYVAASYDRASGRARVEWRLLELGGRTAAAEETFEVDPTVRDRPVLIAAGGLAEDPLIAPRECYNGKIEHPRIYARALSDEQLDTLANDGDPSIIDGLAASWDFAATTPETAVLADVSGNERNGEIVNYPMRGLTGHGWDGSVYRREDAPDQYGAVHFHDDDFEDSRWEADFEFVVPDDQRSGFYAAHLTTAADEDYIPFFVTPSPGVSSADIAYLAPTNTYLAYGNERMHVSDGGMDFSGLTNIPIVHDDLDVFLSEHQEYGGSIYDRHTDGSGVAYSTSRRPIVSMRATHRHWVIGGPRHLPADLALVDWLEQKGHEYDVISDEDIHVDGLARLAHYKVVITASHPEYTTGPMLDAFEQYLAGGGHIMYMGGNGFYWATAVDPERPHVIEVRRGIAGSRAWESHPGEQQMASTGEAGGIWRHLGRAPNKLFGIGFAGQGWDLKTPGYRRLPDSNDPRAAFIFEGIGADEEIGEFGLIMNGAAGDEVDRVDHALGTPVHTLRVATSEGLHSDYYLVCHEDILVSAHETHGTDNPNLRADMVFFETPNDGGVFSVGSINWFGSLSYNNYDNNVSRITDNVLREFSK